MSNSLTEKFRTFSGTAQVAVDVRFSQESVTGIQSALETYVGAVCQILDGARGDWGNGLFYAGGYEVIFSPVKRGGQSFLQTAKVVFGVAVSV